MKAAVELDMNGCPNRCQHCWIGNHPDGNIDQDEFAGIAESFLSYSQNGAPYFSELLFHTWYREPDYAENYRELWDLERQFSTGSLDHFELASAWRLARDPSYAPWLYNIGVRQVQLTFFGTEPNTDYFTRRKGAFRDMLRAIDVLIEAGIAPRIQIFPFSTTLNDVNVLCYKLEQLDLENRVNDIGQELSCFANVCCSPLGNGFNLMKLGLKKQDVSRLTSSLINKTLQYLGKNSIDELSRTEADLLPELMECQQPLNETPAITSFMIDGEGDVYPNCGELTDWWRLGNIREDEVDTIVRNFTEHNVPGLKMNYEMPVNYFARKYGDPAGDRVWSRGDLVQKWMRMEGASL